MPAGGEGAPTPAGGRVRRGTIDDYQLVRLLRSGATAHVWAGHAARTGNAVAVKVARRSNELAATAFAREAAALERLAAADLVVPLLDRLDDGAAPGLVLPWARGALLEVLGRQAPDDVDLVLVLEQLAAALSAVHEQHVVHADVKPANVLLRLDGSIWLTDFGACLVDGTRAPSLRAVGTQGYVAPEVARGATPTPGADVYGWGAVALACLTDRRSVATVGPAATDRRRRQLLRVARRAVAPLAERPPDGAALADFVSDSARWTSTCASSREPADLAASIDDEEAPERPRWDAPTLELGPRPVPPAIARPPSLRRERVLLGAGATALAIGAVVTARSLQVGPPSCPAPPIADAPTATVIEGDDRQGECPVRMAWDPTRAELTRVDPSGAVRHFALGEPGDQLVVGDWDGDGSLTPAVYDPDDGSVLVFGQWPTDDEAEVPGRAATALAPHGTVGRRVQDGSSPSRDELFLREEATPGAPTTT